MPTTPEPSEDREGPEHFGDFEQPRIRPTAAQYEKIFHAALTAGDVKGVEGALIGLALKDPHRAQDLLDITRIGLKVASDPRLRPVVMAALQMEPAATADGLAGKVRAGGQPAVDVAADLATGLLQVAKRAMPDTYYRTDSRCQAARALLASAEEDTEWP